MIELQPTPAPTYSLEDIHQLLLVLEEIKNLSLRPEQTEPITVLIEQIARLIGSENFPVQLSGEYQQQVETLLQSLTPEEVDIIDQAIGQPPIDVAVFTQQELQQILTVLEAIANLNLKPQKNQLIQFLIQQLKPMLAEGRSEILLKTDQAREIEEIVNSLTDEEQERLQNAIPPSETVHTLTMAELQELVSILLELQDFGENPEIAQVARALLPELEQLQAQEQPEVELHGIYAVQLQTILQELMPG